MVVELGTTVVVVVAIDGELMKGWEVLVEAMAEGLWPKPPAAGPVRPF
jgi:hypothetical protein